MSRSLRIALLLTLACVSFGAAAFAFKQVYGAKNTVTIYESCKHTTPQGDQSDCELSPAANASKVTVRRVGG